MTKAQSNGQTQPEFLKTGEFNLKKGTFSIVANIASLLLFVASFIAIIVLFPMPTFGSVEMLPWLYKILLGFVLAVLGIIFSFLVKYLVFKTNDAGKIELHIGLIVEIYSQKPIKRSAYLLSDIIGIMVPIVVFGVLLIVSWGLVFLLALVIHVINFICGIPILVFAFNRPAGSYLKIEQGALCSFKPATP